jgi:hypothetical protein
MMEIVILKQINHHVYIQVVTVDQNFVLRQIIIHQSTDSIFFHFSFFQSFFIKLDVVIGVNNDLVVVVVAEIIDVVVKVIIQ